MEDKMNRFLIIATGILLPVSAIADVQISVNAQYSNNQEYVDDGDGWFEGDEDRGDKQASFEYQWSISGGNHVLRYRQVFFHVSNSSWSFGPWMVRSGYCHRDCHLHHTHHYYRPHPSPYWSRQHDKNNHGRYHYYYKPRPVGPRFHRPPQKVYHHEYYRDRPHDGGHHDINRQRDEQNRHRDELNRQRDEHNRRLDEQNRQRDEHNRQRDEQNRHHHN